MRLKVIAAALLLAVSLSGCTEMAARWVTEANYVQQAGFSYIHEVHALRQWMRGLCRDSLGRSINTAVEKGDEKALRQLINNHYPNLVTADILAAAREDISTVLSEAPGCSSKQVEEPE